MKRVHYAWVVAAVTFIALMGAAGFRATPAILIVPLQNEFGWNRAIISYAVFCLKKKKTQKRRRHATGRTRDVTLLVSQLAKPGTWHTRFPQQQGTPDEHT